MEINIWQVLFQAVNFGVILFVLNKVLYKPVLNLLDDRAKKINEGMALADKNLKAAGETEKLKKEAVASARKEAASIVRTSEADAKKAGEVIIETAKEKAKIEAARILKNAESEVATKNKALEAQVVELAAAMAQKALSASLSSVDAEKITLAILAKSK